MKIISFTKKYAIICIFVFLTFTVKLDSSDPEHPTYYFIWAEMQANMHCTSWPEHHCTVILWEEYCADDPPSECGCSQLAARFIDVYEFCYKYKLQYIEFTIPYGSYD